MYKRQTPDSALPGDEDENTFIYKSPGVSTIDNRNIIYAKVDHAKYQLKQGLESVSYTHLGSGRTNE